MIARHTTADGMRDAVLAILPKLRATVPSTGSSAWTTRKRAEAYVEAGADGIFIPGASDPSDLRELTANIPVPVNVLVVPQLSLAQLADLGVRRVSTGSLPYRAAIDAAVAVTQNIRDGVPPPTATGYPQMQTRLVEFSGR